LRNLRGLLPVLLILLLAAFLRLYRLDTLPPGMYSDIATNGLDIRDIFAGHPKVFFPANNGREAFFIYLQALLVAGAGYHLIVFTFAAVAMGMLSVALSFRLFRSMFGYRVALIAAALFAVAIWGVASSRLGLRFTSLPPFVLAVLYLLWRALHSGPSRYAILAGIAGWFLARKSLAPVLAMSAQAHRIGVENLNERLPVVNPRDELGRLAATFNDLLARLSGAFEIQRRFMADASHELRTPISVLRTTASVMLSRKHRSEEEYRDAVAIVETIRLNRLCSGSLIEVKRKFCSGRRPEERTSLMFTQRCSYHAGRMKNAASRNPVAIA